MAFTNKMVYHGSNCLFPRSLATTGVLASPVVVLLRVGVDKEVSRRNEGVSENNGVSDKTGIACLAIA